jgi:hypothetical protein
MFQLFRKKNFRHKKNEFFGSILKPSSNLLTKMFEVFLCERHRLKFWDRF